MDPTTCYLEMYQAMNEGDLQNRPRTSGSPPGLGAKRRLLSTPLLPD